MPEARFVKTDNTHPEPDRDEQMAEDPVTDPVAEDEATQTIPDEQAAADDSGAPAAEDTLVEEGEVPLTAQLEQAELRAEEYLDSLKRERASFQNYRKRVEHERVEQQRMATGNVLMKLLPILDDFHRAMDAIPGDQRNEWFEGVALIQRKLERFMQDEGVTEIDALGQEFDPNFHEAVGVDSDAGAESGTVTQVLQRGYKHGDRVLRPAMVRVAE
jgi:molecular chaperone GrpE